MKVGDTVKIKGVRGRWANWVNELIKDDPPIKIVKKSLSTNNWAIETTTIHRYSENLKSNRWRENDLILIRTNVWRG